MGARLAKPSNGNMVDRLVESNNYINTPEVEGVFRAVDRAFYYEFEPDSEPVDPYEDDPWRSGNLHLSAPAIYAKVVQALSFEPGMSFLNMGSGTGYLNTIVGLLVGPTGLNHGIEIHADVIEYAYKKLREFQEKSFAIDKYDFCEPTFVKGNCLSLNQAKNYRYDRVYLGAACLPEMEMFMKRLVKPNGGILVMPLEGHLMRHTRLNETEWKSEKLLNVDFTLMIGQDGSLENKPLIELPLAQPRLLKDICRTAIRQQLRNKTNQLNPNLLNCDNVESRRKRRFMYKRAVTRLSEAVFREAVQLDNRKNRKNSKGEAHCNRCCCRRQRYYTEDDRCCSAAISKTTRPTARIQPPRVTEVADLAASQQAGLSTEPPERIQTRSASRAMVCRQQSSSSELENSSAGCTSNKQVHLVEPSQKAVKFRGLAESNLNGHVQDTNPSDSRGKQQGRNNCDEQTTENTDCARTRPYRQRTDLLGQEVSTNRPSNSQEFEPNSASMPRIKLQRPQNLQLPSFSTPFGANRTASSSSDDDEQDSDDYSNASSEDQEGFRFSPNCDNNHDDSDSSLTNSNGQNDDDLAGWFFSGSSDIDDDEDDMGPKGVFNHDGEVDESPNSARDSSSLSSSSSDYDSDDQVETSSRDRQAPRDTSISIKEGSVSNEVRSSTVEEFHEKEEQPVASRLRSKCIPVRHSNGRSSIHASAQRCSTENGGSSTVTEKAYVRQGDNRLMLARDRRQMQLSGGDANVAPACNATSLTDGRRRPSSAAPPSTVGLGNPVERKSRGCCCCCSRRRKCRRRCQHSRHCQLDASESVQATSRRCLATAPRVVELDNSDLYSSPSLSSSSPSSSSSSNPPHRPATSSSNFVALQRQLLTDRFANSLRSSLPLGASCLLSGGSWQAAQHFRMLASSRRASDIDAQLTTNAPLLYRRDLSSASSGGAVALESGRRCMATSAFQLPEPRRHHYHKCKQHHNHRQVEHQDRKRKRDSLSESSEASSPIRLRATRDSPAAATSAPKTGGAAREVSDELLTGVTPGAAASSAASETQRRVAATATTSSSGFGARPAQRERPRLDDQVNCVDFGGRSGWSLWRDFREAERRRELEAVARVGGCRRRRLHDDDDDDGEASLAPQQSASQRECRGAHKQNGASCKKRRRRRRRENETEKYHKHIYSYILQLPLPRVLHSYLNYDRKS